MKHSKTDISSTPFPENLFTIGRRKELRILVTEASTLKNSNAQDMHLKKGYTLIQIESGSPFSLNLPYQSLHTSLTDVATMKPVRLDTGNTSQPPKAWQHGQNANAQGLLFIMISPEDKSVLVSMSFVISLSA